MTPFWVTAASGAEATELERLSHDPASGIGRRISAAEWRRFQPNVPEPVAAFEPADGFAFSPKLLATQYGKPYEIGTHGLWPGRPNYRSVFLVWGPEIGVARLPEISILDIYTRLRAIALGK